MNDMIFNSMQMIDFNNDAENYRKVIKIILNSIADIISKKEISYDFKHLSNRISSLKVIRRDGEDHEYEEINNELYLSLCGPTKKEYNDVEIIIFIIHELVHFSNHPDNSNDFYKTYTGFDEFFTEYLTLIIASKIGGINLESYYRKNIKGYFGEENSTNFMKNLVEKFGLTELLDCYVNRNKNKLTSLVGNDILKNMNEYHDYYTNLIDNTDKSIREINEILKNPDFLVQKNTIDKYSEEINYSIINHENFKKL